MIAPVAPIFVGNERKLSRYRLNGGDSLFREAVECMARSEATDEFLLGKAEGLCTAIAHMAGVDKDWLRDYVCVEAF